MPSVEVQYSHFCYKKQGKRISIEKRLGQWQSGNTYLENKPMELGTGEIKSGDYRKKKC